MSLLDGPLPQHDDTVGDPGPIRRLRLGFALNLATQARDPRAVKRVYDEVVDTIVFAEHLGLDSVWVGQHHFDNTDGPVPSPLVFLAAVARHTQRITLGTGITTLPLEDPLRLAEDAAVLDALAGGRLQLGLGTGGANLDGFRSFGLRSEDRHALYEQRMARLHRILEGESLVAGQDGPRLYPPGTGLRRRLWQAATTEDGARRAARSGDGLQLGAFFDPAAGGQRPKAAAYHAELRALDGAASPRVAVFRFVYPGPSKRAVATELAPVLGARLHDLARRAAISGNTALGTWSLTQYLDAVTLYGTPEDIVEQVAADPVIGRFGSDFVANFSYRDEFSRDVAQRRLEVLAEDIGPAVGWKPTGS